MAPARNKPPGGAQAKVAPVAHGVPASVRPACPVGTSALSLTGVAQEMASMSLHNRGEPFVKGQVVGAYLAVG